ncbi:OV-17 antigen [Ditylenchus destructor]|uniref:OV-17 antigen n=1 Tax=Ditylenchus destructor TaxID=166010 RepID=A0AAD4N138_9BILA|nr:OV-17 antigen [Ditylenchus destructor]
MCRLFVCVIVAVFLVLTNAQQAPPPPPFLQGASPDVINDFHKLLAQTAAKTDSQIDEAVDQWISKQDASIKTKYTQFKAAMKQQHEAADAAHKAAIDKFSPDAKAADEKLSAVATNSALTAEQKGREIEKIVNSLSPSVRQEIEKAMRGGQ